MTARKNTAPRTPSRGHHALIGVVVTGAVVIAGTGFAGSYSAVRDLALDKGFGTFSNVFPIGIDAGIVVLLALDLLLTWIRIPFPLLRQTAWLLTAATIAFNGAAAWPDPIGVGMHAVIPILFVVSVEAARHAVGRIADITADRHMESVRITRWLLAPIPTFRLWRRMKLWELRSYDEVIRLEQDRLVYQARLRARYGRAWRRKAPVESLMPLRLARYGVPLSDTAPAGLAAAGLEPSAVSPTALPRGRSDAADGAAAKSASPGAQPGPYGPPGALEGTGTGGTGAADAPQQQPQPTQPTVPAGPNDWTPQLGGEGTGGSQSPYVPQQRQPEQHAYGEQLGQALNQLPHSVPREEVYYATFRQYLADHNRYPSAYQFGQRLREMYGVPDLSNSELIAYIEEFKKRLPVEVSLRRPLRNGHIKDGHDHRMAVPEQPGEPRAGYEEKPGWSGPELSQTRRQDPAGNGPPAGHRTSDDATSAPQTKTDTEPPVPPLKGEVADVRPGPPGEPPKKADPEQKADEQPPVVETVADRYYIAWRAYRDQHGAPPNGVQLSQWLYDGGVTGRNGQAVSPSTLRRYIASFPCYEVWAEHTDNHGQEPTSEELEKLLADRKVMRNNGGTPWTLADLQRLLPEFQRRHRLCPSL